MESPFLELPVCLVGNESNPEKIVKGNFLPAQIVAYQEDYSQKGTVIYLQGGQPVLISMTIDKFQDALQRYWETVFRKKGLKIHR